MKKWLVFGALALLVVVFVIGVQKEESVVERFSATSGSPSFEVRVVKPRSALPIFGLVPSSLFGVPAELGFDDASPGAEVGRVGKDRLELRAVGWDFTVVTDGEGRPASGTNLVFSLELGGRYQTLRCRPSERPPTPAEHIKERLGFQVDRPEDEDGAKGYLQTRSDADGVRGSLRVELSTCENIGTGKTINWPPAPLVVSGSFERLPAEGR
ncbi:MAG: hypothetical protein AAF481_04660 [Acidobacteriota bacterium]